MNTYGYSNQGYIKNAIGAQLTLTVDFYDDEFQDKPFIHTEGAATGNDKIGLCNALFWQVLKGLKGEGYLLKQ
jgi:hypothetical protein